MSTPSRDGRRNPPRSTVALAHANREAIIQALLDQGPMSRPEIAAAVGMSMATVLRLVAGLMDQGLVVPAGRRADTGGRPSMLVAIAPRSVVTVAVGVGRYTTRTALVDLAGETFDVAEYDFFGDLDPQERLENTLAAAEAAAARAAEQRLRCVGVGVTVPGSVLPDGVVDSAPGLDWRSIPLGALVTQRTGLPATVENDANVFAFVEHRRGTDAGASCLVTLLLTTRISVGIMMDGRLFRGGRSAAGEIGHMMVEPASLDRLYPKTGDLDGRLGAAGVSARLEALTGEHLDVPTNVGKIVDRADGGDADAERIAAELLDELALTVANLCVVLDPDVLILCGRIGESADLIVPGLVERITGRIPHLPRITGPSPGADPWLVGVGIMAREARGSLVALVG